MNREIKFRAWDRIEEKMKGVSVISFGDDGAALTLLFDGAPRKEYGDNLVHGESGILMQFTGLKDKNGKEIYEGDIVLHHVKGDDDKYQHVIVWNQSAFALAKSPDDIPTSFILDKHWGDLLEVIGNIYENPDLLK